MDKDHIFERGKYVGKTVAWVEENNPSYLVWVKKEAPNLLKPSIKKETKVETSSPIPMRDSESSRNYPKPNLDFWDEGPDEISKTYLNKDEK